MKKIKPQIKEYSSILNNTAMLVIMQFSNILLGILTTGYQARTLGKLNSGILDYAANWMVIFQLIMDFGFMISATGKISRYRHDQQKLNAIFTRVILSKLILITATAVILAVLMALNFITIGSATEFYTYWLYLLSTALMALLPDFYFRGIEKMSAIMVRSVSVKIAATVLIFTFVKSQTDYYKIPLFTALGNIVALFWVYRYLFTKSGLRLTRTSPKDILSELKDSSQFFVSRIASTVYGSINAIILEKFVDPTKTISGFYKKAEYVTNAAKNGVVSPIADSIYPYTMRNKNLKVIKKALLLVTPVVFAGCAVFYLFAEPICTLWLDAEMGPEVAPALRALLPVVVISVPGYILGFPTLAPLGLAKQANRSINFGTVFHMIALIGLYVSGSLTIISLCYLTCITEFFIMTYRVIVVLRYRKHSADNHKPNGTDDVTS